jgi:hypothetical protein
MSALGQNADMAIMQRDVRFAPKADISKEQKSETGLCVCYRQWHEGRARSPGPQSTFDAASSQVLANSR